MRLHQAVRGITPNGIVIVSRRIHAIRKIRDFHVFESINVTRNLQEKETRRECSRIARSRPLLISDTLRRISSATARALFFH